MKVILKPVSHPRLGNIDIVDDLFAIGRNEEPFASKLGEDASSLSRRHARVFRESGKIFLADLGSRNGTRVNHRELKHNVATPLKNNDRVVFADILEFRVEIRQPTVKTASKAAAIRLELVPDDPASGLESIAIESFPFLVSRNEGEFAGYRESLPEAWRRLSRRHAVIALKGGRVNVEDLGSANGTYVGGERLDERARELTDGDTLAFGDSLFSYTVRVGKLHAPTEFAGTLLGRSDQAPARVATQQHAVVLQAEPQVSTEQPAVIKQSAAVEQPRPIEQPAAESRSAGANRTRFVSSADSFINVFCADGELREPQGGKDAASTRETRQLKAPDSGLGKLRRTLGELWQALGGSSSVDRRFVWGAAGVLGVIVAATAITYFIGLERREIKTLFDAGNYGQSATVANSYLEHNRDDQEVGAWADEALMRSVVPEWVEYIEQGRFQDAAQYLATQREAYKFIPRGLQTIDALAWAGKVEAHMADRGGASGSIVLFRHEEPIRALVQEWSTDSFKRQQVLDQMVARVPAFEPIHTRIFSALTSLRSDNSIYVKAIDELKTNVQAALKRNDRKAVTKLIEDFGSNYARVTGVDALRDDMTRYETLEQLVRQKELLQLVHMQRSAQFRTPIFAEYVDGWLAKELPPADIVSKYAEAAAAWQAGNHDKAIATLESAKNGPWGEVATRQIARYQQIGADYSELQASKGSDGYYDRLLTVWSALRPNEDAHLIQALEPDFVAHRDQVLPRLERSLERVRDYWSEYQGDGGISGVTRVEGRVTPKFTGQAKRLSSAYREISSGARTYRLLQVSPPPEWQTLQREIVDEVQRQRRWLQDLNIVLEPRLLHAKLDLLPDVSEQSLWVQSTTGPKRD